MACDVTEEALMTSVNLSDVPDLFINFFQEIFCVCLHYNRNVRQKIEMFVCYLKAKDSVERQKVLMKTENLSTTFVG